ncbi:patatin-like phospholipase family protein [Methylobacterium radiodurans]|uniref:Patatin n=1 Tax=Methylobacterium radiodurans TaxID=2202828 RepID=A0A2U8VV58_9HYPH|nr:patatin-like phospholipase family protein [Methylobacterium radiodurans]AWN37683.1 patatin [Methylobacterium radiodurans]
MPVDPRLSDEPAGGPEPGIALCLSGGGYRAMVFHLGTLIRLNEAGILGKLSRVSSVSGGSITAAVLGLHWRELRFEDCRATRLDLVTDKVLRMASTDVDAGAIVGGILLPGTISDRVAAAYDRILFDGASLSDLPDDGAGEGPRFVINATNVQTAALWRFSRPYMGDYRVGLVKDPDVRLATAVAASSAFPPVLSPLELEVRQPYADDIPAELDSPAYRERVTLSDGGVYDNLGLETAIKRYETLFVSDGGQKVAAEEHPATDWARHAVRILDVVDNQVRSLRKRGLIDAFRRGARTGAYWGIRTRFEDYGTRTDPLGCTSRDPSDLAATPTRLQAMPRGLQERLTNWGYAICDAALRTHVDDDLQARLGVQIGEPRGFPYPRAY